MPQEEYELSWENSTRKDILKIHAFIAKNVSVELANETVRGLYNAVEPLRNTPERFSREQSLLHRKEMFRYIKYKKYKILYSVERQVVHILSIFPARQNPKKLVRKFK
ncbi:MAG: hypothetical protein RLZZ292_2894 [Bacteroidota bacterium]|jgi:plasmid stabilization system protein ParE